VESYTSAADSGADMVISGEKLATCHYSTYASLQLLVEARRSLPRCRPPHLLGRKACPAAKRGRKKLVVLVFEWTGRVRTRRSSAGLWPVATSQARLEDKNVSRIEQDYSCYPGSQVSDQIDSTWLTPKIDSTPRVALVHATCQITCRKRIASRR